MEIGRKIFLYIAIAFVFSLSQCAASASKKSYIVYMGGHVHGKQATSQDYIQATDSHYNLLASFTDSMEEARNAIFYSYTKHINGFAAFLSEDQLKMIKSHPNVVSVFPNDKMQHHTTRSWELLNLEVHDKPLNYSLWEKADFGSDTIIACLDTGVWPESESFNDRGMGPVPSRWRGSCVNDTKAGVPCNRKLIGAKYFNKGFLAAGGGDRVQAPNVSPRDMEGHGTHTLSTAAGNPVAGASFFGRANGTAKGGSPAARAAMYKVCWENCYNADILAGFDEAIDDGADVISVSLGGPTMDYMYDPVAIGSFHAMARGISVVCSAGNSGPYDGSVTNTAPWVTTVAASTLDREFPSYVTLGNKKKLEGRSRESKSLPKNKFYPLINSVDIKAANASSHQADLCFWESLDPKKVKGKIVICRRGEISRMEKGQTVNKAGGVGMIVVNDELFGESLTADPELFPSTNIGYKDGLTLGVYMKSTKLPIGTISAPMTRYGVKPTPVMANFTSRGPGLISPQIIKPDITAPGVDILAAFTNATSPTNYDYDTRRVAFNMLSGTSMSCPHVSGITGLLKALHPDWNPSAIRSAIMTTAITRDNTGHKITDWDETTATPFAYGSGHIRPNRAADPGLVYDLTIDDYLNFLCASGYNSTMLAVFDKKPHKCPSKPMNIEDLNYPSIAAPSLNSSMTVLRTVKNVGFPGTYKVRIEAPAGISVSVKPKVLKFSKVGEEKGFQVKLKSKGSTKGEYAFGGIIWTDGRHHVRSPLAVMAV